MVRLDGSGGWFGRWIEPADQVRAYRRRTRVPKGRVPSADPCSPATLAPVPMRQDCRFFESRTYPSGETVRKLIDCLIDAVAARVDAEILHADADFLALARHTDLKLHSDSPS